MTSEYFDASANHLTPGTRARAVDVNNALNAIDTGLAKLPTEAQLKRGTVNYAVDTGAANAVLVDLPSGPAAYVDGMEVIIKPAAANTGATTINVNSLGVKDIRRQDGSVLIAADLGANKILSMRYNGTSGYFEIVGSLTASAGTMATQNANAVTITGGTVAGKDVTTLMATTDFGTVVDSDVTTTDTDTTANRITKVGDFGVGGDSITITDWDDATIGGAMYKGDSAANAPPITGWALGTYHRLNASYGTQMAESLTLASPRKFFRSNINTAWTDWAEIYHTANQLYTVVAANTTMVAHRKYSVNTSAAARTMTLPATATATAGDWVEIVDAAGTFHLNNCTVARNSHNIMGLAENLTADEQNAAFKLVYVDATYGWRLA